MLRLWRSLAGDPHGRRLEADLGAVVAPEARGEAALADLDAIELLEKVDVEEGAPELAVGDAAQADLLLAADHVADRRVLDRAQRLGVDLAAARRARASSRRLRPQQAADVVGPERRRRHRPGFPWRIIVTRADGSGQIAPARQRGALGPGRLPCLFTSGFFHPRQAPGAVIGLGRGAWRRPGAASSGGATAHAWRRRRAADRGSGRARAAGGRSRCASPRSAPRPRPGARPGAARGGPAASSAKLSSSFGSWISAGSQPAAIRCARSAARAWSSPWVRKMPGAHRQPLLDPGAPAPAGRHGPSSCRSCGCGP